MDQIRTWTAFGQHVLFLLAIGRPQFVSKVAHSNKNELILKFNIVFDNFHQTLTFKLKYFALLQYFLMALCI